MRQPRLMQAAAVLAIASATVVASDARAQGFDAQSFAPAPALSTNYWNAYSSEILPDRAWEIDLTLTYTNDPLNVYQAGSSDRVGSLIDHQLMINAAGAVSIGTWFQIGIDVPVIVLQRGDDLPGITDPGSPGEIDNSAGIGDIRLVPSFRLYDGVKDGERGVSVGLHLDTRLPTGNADSYQGGEFRFEPIASVDYRFRQGAKIGGNIGYVVRNSLGLGNLEIDDGLTWAAAGSVPVDKNKRLFIVPEVVGTVGVVGDDLDQEERTFEGLLGAKYFPVPEWMVHLGAGTGLRDGIGTPDYRVFMGLGYIHQNDDDDRDGDGIADDDDQCPNDPEDSDGFEDADGCPDPDNDQDTVLDEYDQCPIDAEDIDGFEDEDGCPDLDDDLDNDGILNDDDQCPNDPEDIDGFEDTDGCPDTDNDQDTVLDVDDTCPIDAEDFDGFEDADGCPDTDNDSDGILDENDDCPDESEDFDGFEDTDGCPEEGSGLVQLTCTSIEIHEAVYFGSSSAEILDRSFELLDQVSGVLNGAAYIELVSVEGHTDDRGAAEFNRELSQRRADAVMQALIERGIDPSRLRSVGHGEDNPIANNETREGRAENRRVEFIIVEQSNDCVDTREE